ncbi:adenylosuccinate synthetase [Candidatus Pacearchaeota archaeon]|nr:adenylosuccinate synthetase [Candidatus Pacearchaeota archaeon]
MYRVAYVVVGLGFGDEGKGTTIDYLVHKRLIKMVAKFNGGPQAAHHVVTPSGEEHCFSQFGSGTFQGARTFLSKYFYVEPFALIDEAIELVIKNVKQPFDMLDVSSECRVVTPYHKYIGQMVELSKDPSSKHGTVGLGVGQAVYDYRRKGVDALTVGDFHDPQITRAKLKRIRAEITERADNLLEAQLTNSALRDPWMQMRTVDIDELIKCYYLLQKLSNVTDENLADIHLSSIACEGSQGALLDIDYGFWPHVTKSTTTVHNALKLVGPKWNVERIGVIRAFETRHGPGPFPTESLILKERLKEKHNDSNEWQGDFRVGWLDLIMTKYAIELNGGIEYISLTNLDKLSGMSSVHICTEYEYTGTKSVDVLSKYFQVYNTPHYIKIRGIKYLRLTDEERLLVTEIISECHMSDSMEFRDWNYDMKSRWPSVAERFVSAIERYLNVPVRIISRGETAFNKYER